ncbi:MAG TPA: hypothetical protein VMM17_09860 [Gemmatimonadaceae bacterium]|nr:hypothetical protein [Gemmatimonadaceae bacterium]
MCRQTDIAGGEDDLGRLLEISDGHLRAGIFRFSETLGLAPALVSARTRR